MTVRLQGIIVHRDWRILFANRAAAQTLGYSTVEDLVSVESFLQLLPEDERSRFETYRDARLRGEPAPERYQGRLLHKDGATIWVDILPSILNWQGERAIQSTFVDISDSVRTQQMLHESEERLRTFMDNTPALMTLKSLDNRYLMVNRAFQDFVQKSRDTAVGSTPSQLMTADHANAIAEHDQMVLEENRAVTVDRDLIGLDGTRYCRRVTKFPVYDADEKLIGIGSDAVDLVDCRDRISTQTCFAVGPYSVTVIRGDQVQMGIEQLHVRDTAVSEHGRVSIIDEERGVVRVYDADTLEGALDQISKALLALAQGASGIFFVGNVERKPIPHDRAVAQLLWARKGSHPARATSWVVDPNIHTNLLQGVGRFVQCFHPAFTVFGMKCLEQRLRIVHDIFSIYSQHTVQRVAYEGKLQASIRAQHTTKQCPRQVLGDRVDE